MRSRHIIKAVNICENHLHRVAHVIGAQPIQYEFGFCESMPENLVKNLLVNAKSIDVNSISYENSHVVPHTVNRDGHL